MEQKIGRVPLYDNWGECGTCGRLGALDADFDCQRCNAYAPARRGSVKAFTVASTQGPVLGFIRSQAPLVTRAREASGLHDTEIVEVTVSWDWPDD